MPAGIGRFFVNGDVDQGDERLEQTLQLYDQLPVGQRHRRLRRQRLGQPLIGGREFAHRATVRIERIDQLQDAGDLVLVIFERHGKERLRTVARRLIKAARPGKIEALRDIGVGDIHSCLVQS